MICTCIPWYPFILYSIFSPNTSSHIYGSGICIPFSNGLGIFIQSNFALTLFSRSIPFFPHHSPHNRWFIKITPKNMNLLYHIHFWWTSSFISWPKVFSWVLLFLFVFFPRENNLSLALPKVEQRVHFVAKQPGSVKVTLEGDWLGEGWCKFRSFWKYGDIKGMIDIIWFPMTIIWTSRWNLLSLWLSNYDPNIIPVYCTLW
jgi:hypothetical protein